MTDFQKTSGDYPCRSQFVEGVAQPLVLIRLHLLQTAYVERAQRENSGISCFFGEFRAPRVAGKQETPSLLLGKVRISVFRMPCVSDNQVCVLADAVRTDLAPETDVASEHLSPAFVIGAAENFTVFKADFEIARPAVTPVSERDDGSRIGRPRD